jgi:hypothetical protein
VLIHDRFDRALREDSMRFDKMLPEISHESNAANCGVKQKQNEKNDRNFLGFFL